MALTSYSTLITAVGDWLERADTDALVPDWIALTEAHMNRRLRVGRMITRTASFSVDAEFESVPTDFLAPRSARLTSGDKNLLKFFTPEQMAEYKEFNGDTGGDLFAYAVVGTEFEFAPVPTSTYTVALSYYAKIPALTVSNTSNWVLASSPDAYLHGCLMFAGSYYQDAGLRDEHATLFNAALERIEAGDRSSAFAANITTTPSQYAV